MLFGRFSVWRVTLAFCRRLLVRVSGCNPLSIVLHPWRFSREELVGDRWNLSWWNLLEMLIGVKLIEETYRWNWSARNLSRRPIGDAYRDETDRLIGWLNPLMPIGVLSSVKEVESNYLATGSHFVTMYAWKSTSESQLLTFLTCRADFPLDLNTERANIEIRRDSRQSRRSHRVVTERLMSDMIPNERHDSLKRPSCKYLQIDCKRRI